VSAKLFKWVFIVFVVCLLPFALARPAQMTKKAILTGISIDKIGAEYEMTGKMVGAKKSKEVSGKDAEFANTVNKIAAETDKAVSFAHCNNIILKAGLENEDLREILKFFLHNAELNNNTCVSWEEKCSKQNKVTLEQFMREPKFMGAGPDKTAVFKDGKFDFELNERQTDALAYVTGGKPMKRVQAGGEYLLLKKNSAKNSKDMIKISVSYKLESNPLASDEKIEELKIARGGELLDDVRELNALLGDTRAISLDIEISE
jgi:CO dehydrogenase/acetyl-CoA synthase gamma subunit (corrinoid Fe-S protein)